MSSTSSKIPDDVFERDLERHEAQKRRVSMRRKRTVKNDPVDEARRLRNARRKRFEDEDYLEDEDLDLGDDYDYQDTDDFRERIERGRDFFDYDD